VISTANAVNTTAKRFPPNSRAIMPLRMLVTEIARAGMSRTARNDSPNIAKNTRLRTGTSGG
jgi:hypothetical protein